MAQPQSNQAQEHTPNVTGHTTIASARDVVSVACKLPNGLIIREMVKSVEAEPVQGGGLREVTYHRPTGEQMFIEGTAAPYGAKSPPLLNAGGFRVTKNVPKALWESWRDANAKSDLIRNGLIYASEKRDDIEGHSREHEKSMTGLEGVDPSNPGKHVRGIVRGDKPK